MFSYLKSFFVLLFLNISFLFGSPVSAQSIAYHRHFRSDIGTSYGAGYKLARAQHILATLVPDPQNYTIIISNNPTFGGEAVAPHVLSDKQTIIIYQGSLSPNRSNEEIAFMMAHEIGHLQLHHNEKMDHQMQRIFQGPPTGISGTIFNVFYQKLQERQADMFGLYLYRQAGYDLNFFPHMLGIMKRNANLQMGMVRPFQRPHSSLSMHDSHFAMSERFEHLVQQLNQYG